jgi:pantoate kinase
MSAAGAVATGLAVAKVLRLPAQRAWETAHLADLFLGGGLGGVAVLRSGGYERRTKAGVPPFGTVQHAPWSGPIRLFVAGPPLPSPSVLRTPGFLAKVGRAGRRAIRTLGRGENRVAFLRASERFTEDLGLASPVVRKLLEEIRTEEVAAAQAMFGELVFAAPRAVPGPPWRPPGSTRARSVLDVRAGVVGAGPLARGQRQE